MDRLGGYRPRVGDLADRIGEAIDAREKVLVRDRGRGREDAADIHHGGGREGDPGGIDQVDGPLGGELARDHRELVEVHAVQGAPRRLLLEIDEEALPDAERVPVDHAVRGRLDDLQDVRLAVNELRAIGLATRRQVLRPARRAGHDKAGKPDGPGQPGKLGNGTHSPGHFFPSPGVPCPV